MQEDVHAHTILPFTPDPALSPPACSISDLLLLNPGLSAMKNGQNLSLPCYPTDKGPGPHMPYMGGNVAFGMVGDAALLCSCSACHRGMPALISMHLLTTPCSLLAGTSWRGLRGWLAPWLRPRLC